MSPNFTPGASWAEFGDTLLVRSDKVYIYSDLELGMDAQKRLLFNHLTSLVIPRWFVDQRLGGTRS